MNQFESGHPGRKKTWNKTDRTSFDFFTFQLTVEENVALLNITGSEGAKELL
jgi:hypothetical protein